MPHDLHPFSLGTTLVEKRAIPIDVQRLIETRALVEANSGAGKSYTLRRLLEQTYGQVQHIVIDVEGEFHTLRESLDYVLAAPKGGDCVATTGTAQLLARRLLELGVSAIIDIYELGAGQPLFVKLFLESLMSAPRDLWHPVLVVVDEAHKFCPEKADAVSAPAVIDLMTRGRKRGFAGVLATQRLSKLDKDAAAEANNLVIGRTALDLDITRAASVLGMSLKDARTILPKLEPGEFFVVGPALSPTVERIRIGQVSTTHPKAGTRGAPPTPPRHKVKAILGKLADLPAEAEEEVKTTEQLRGQVRELQAEIRRMVGAPRPDEVKAERDRIASLDKLADENKKMSDAIQKLMLQLDEARRFEQVQADVIDKIVTEVDHVLDRLTAARNEFPNALDEFVREYPITPMAVELDAAGRRFAKKHGMVGEPAQKVRAARMVADNWAPSDRKTFFHNDIDDDGPPTDVPVNGKRVRTKDGLPAMHRAFLTVLAQHADRVYERTGVGGAGLTKSKILVYAGYARSGNTNKTFAEITRQNWIVDITSNEYAITKEGRAVLGDYEKMPRGRALRERIAADLNKVERKIFETVCGAYPQEVTKSAVLAAAGYARSGNTNAAFAHLVARDYLVQAGPGALRAAQELFE